MTHFRNLTYTQHLCVARIRGVGERVKMRAISESKNKPVFSFKVFYLDRILSVFALVTILNTHYRAIYVDISLRSHDFGRLRAAYCGYAGTTWRLIFHLRVVCFEMTRMTLCVVLGNDVRLFCFKYKQMLFRNNLNTVYTL